MKIRAVIFDGDGVIFDSVGLHQKAHDEFCGKYGLSWLDFGNPSAYLKRRGFSEKQIREYLEIFERHDREMKIFPAVNEVLCELRRRKIVTGIFTNRQPRGYNFEAYARSGLDLSLLDFFLMFEKRPWWKRLNNLPDPKFWKYRHKIYKSTRYGKPSSWGILRVLHKLWPLPGFPSSVCMVGDSEIDLEFARGNDFQFIGVLSGAVKNPENWRGLEVKHIVKDISEVAEICDKIKED